MTAFLLGAVVRHRLVWVHVERRKPGLTEVKPRTELRTRRSQFGLGFVGAGTLDSPLPRAHPSSKSAHARRIPRAELRQRLTQLALMLGSTTGTLPYHLITVAPYLFARSMRYPPAERLGMR